VTARDEQGSLIVALAVILVLSGLSLAILARTISALGSARLAQDSAAATEAADTGITDALYVLDHSPGTLSGSGPSFSWTAVLASPATGTVTSTGKVNGRSHTVTVGVSRQAQWPWVLATTGSLVLDGAVTVDSAAPIAAGGPIVVRGEGASTPTDGASQQLLGPGASCSGCDKPAHTPADTQLPEPLVPSPTPSAPPGGCTGITTLPTGVWLCEDLVSFSTTTAVSIGPGSVELYVVPSGPSPASLSFAGATVAPTSNHAGDLVVHVVGPGVVIPDGGSFTGILDAPHSTLRSNPCRFTLTGAADLGSFDCFAAPAPGATLNYDPSLTGQLSATWREASYADATP